MVQLILLQIIEDPMPVALTAEQLESVQNGQGLPVPVMDTASQKLYFIITAEQMETVRAVIEDQEFRPAEFYPLIAKTAGAAGWNSPEMDEYDNYDEHKRQISARRYRLAANRFCFGTRHEIASCRDRAKRR